MIKKKKETIVELKQAKIIIKFEFPQDNWATQIAIAEPEEITRKMLWVIFEEAKYLYSKRANKKTNKPLIRK